MVSESFIWIVVVALALSGVVFLLGLSVYLKSIDREDLAQVLADRMIEHPQPWEEEE